MQKICWYFWLHYGIQRRSDSSPTAQTFVRLTISLQNNEYCRHSACPHIYWIISWGTGKKMNLETARNNEHSFSQAFLYTLDTVIIKIQKLF